MVFPDFRLSRSLAPFDTTTIELPPAEPGEYGFACGMNMLHGTVLVEQRDEHDQLPQEVPEQKVAAVEQAQGALAAPTGRGAEVREQARGVTDANRETARAVGVGPTVPPQPGCERVEFTLPGALRTLPTNTSQAEEQLRAIGGVNSAQVNFGAERVVLTYDPSLVDRSRLASAVAEATGYEPQERGPESGPQEDVEATAREAEVRDLRWRVGLGAVLTAPVLYAAMVGHFISPALVPELLQNPWTQLLLSLPVMVLIGWPIHRTGLLTLRNRSADMNTLISLGTIAALGYSLLATVAPAGPAGRRAGGVLRGRQRDHHDHPPRTADRGTGSCRDGAGDPVPGPAGSPDRPRTTGR